MLREDKIGGLTLESIVHLSLHTDNFYGSFGSVRLITLGKFKVCQEYHNKKCVKISLLMTQFKTMRPKLTSTRKFCYVQITSRFLTLLSIKHQPYTHLQTKEPIESLDVSLPLRSEIGSWYQQTTIINPKAIGMTRMHLKYFIKSITFSKR